jgi:hypothetical protein
VSSGASAAAGLPEAASEIVASLAAHRILTTAQVRAIHLPERKRRRVQQVLATLEQAGLIRHALLRTAPRRLWYVSEAGAQAALDSGLIDERPRVLGAAQAAGQLREHTLAVNDAAISFLRAARERGDECGALSWRHEVAHPLTSGRGRRRRALYADAVLTYLRLEPEETVVEQRFIELDRATLPVDRLAAELARYAGLYAASDRQGEPLWRSRYPSFPPVLCVLAGAAPAALARRRDTVAALLRADPWLSRARGVAIRICLAAELAEHGPFAPIFYEVRDPGRAVDWLGRSPVGGEERK